jgi:hypothetical protein
VVAVFEWCAYVHRFAVSASVLELPSFTKLSQPRDGRIGACPINIQTVLDKHQARFRRNGPGNHLQVRGVHRQNVCGDEGTCLVAISLNTRSLLLGACLLDTVQTPRNLAHKFAAARSVCPPTAAVLELPSDNTLCLPPLEENAGYGTRDQFIMTYCKYIGQM